MEFSFKTEIGYINYLIEVWEYIPEEPASSACPYSPPTIGYDLFELDENGNKTETIPDNRLDSIVESKINEEWEKRQEDIF